MTRLIKFIIKYRIWLIAGILLMILTLSPWLAKIKIGSTYAGLHPPKNDPERIFIEQMNAEFGGDNVATVAVISDNIFSASTLEKVQRLTSEFEKLPAVSYVWSLTNASILKSTNDEMHVKNISRDIPSTPQALKAFRNDILSNPLYLNSLITEDQSTTLINAVIANDVSDKESRHAVEEIRRLAPLEAGPEEIYVNGTATIAAEVFQMASRDITTYLPITLLIIIIILSILFRNLYIVLISVFAIAISVVCTYAIMAIKGIPLTAFTVVIPPIISALGIAYLIHFFTEFFRQKPLTASQGKATEQTLKNVLLAIWLSVMTTAIGFASLTLIDIVAIRRMGLLLVLGILFLLALLTFLIPPLLTSAFPKIPPKKKHASLVLQKILERFLNLCLRYRTVVFISVIAATVLGIAGVFRLTVTTDILHGYFRPSSAVAQAIRVISSRLHGNAPMSIYIDGQKENALENPKLLRSIEKLQNALDRESVVSKTISVADYVKSVNKAMHNDDPAYYKLPNSEKEISQYLLVYSLGDEHRILDRYIDYEQRIARISLGTSLHRSNEFIAFRDHAAQLSKEILPKDIVSHVSSDIILTSIACQRVAWGIIKSFGLAVLAICLIMVILFRSIKMGLIAMVPNLLPLLFILGFMGWANIDFNIGTSIVICVAIGIAVDDTIHFLVRYLYELRQTNHYLVRTITGARITEGQKQAIFTTMSHVGKPIIFTSVAIFCGFLVLGFSEFLPIALFGVLTAITMVYCLICDLIILPILLTSIKI